MIAPDEALARVLALAEPVEIGTVPLLEAAGRWAVLPVIAERTQPARDLSSMDGYAIRYVDMPGPWRVIGESAAGAPFPDIVNRNEAVRIFTGAALPSAADGVVVQEMVNRDGDLITLTGEGPDHVDSHVRRKGSDFAAGDVLIEAGVRLTPARIGLAAIAGYSALPVCRRIRVAVISTGDELVAIGTDPGGDHLPSSNAIMIAAMLGPLPVEISDFGIVPDDRIALGAAFNNAADHDIVVTTGGASVGDRDFVQSALNDAGAAIDFWKIAMRPGKPLMAGRLGKAIALGLPGNPVSAFVTATLFLKPLIEHLSGASHPAPPMITALLATDLPAVGARSDFIRAHWVNGGIAPLEGDSGMLVPLASASALIVRPARMPPARKGDTVSIIILA